MTKLKPCQFCGSTDIALIDDGADLCVECTDCHCRGAWEPTAEKSIAAWNRRTVTREQVEAAARSIADGLFFAHEIDAGCEHSKDFAIFAFRAAGFEVEG